jgi:hypothetical protein
MPETHLVLEVHSLDPVPGAWCDACALPSVIEVPMLVVDAPTLRVLARPLWRECQVCGQRRSSWGA